MDYAQARAGRVCPGVEMPHSSQKSGLNGAPVQRLRAGLHCAAALRLWSGGCGLRGLKSVRENPCRPYGTRAFVPLHPALPCRAVISRRYAAGVLVVLAELAV